MALKPLTRKQAHAALIQGGWPVSMLDIMTAVGAQESSLRIDVTGPKNANGTEDYGWLQINSMYVTGSPYYDKTLLLSDAAYTAKAAYGIYMRQGIRAWVAYTSGDYKKFMPPPVGAPIAQGSPAWFLVADVQDALNRALGTALVTDGAFGPRTLATLQDYQKLHPVEPNVVGQNYWKMLEL